MRCLAADARCRSELERCGLGGSTHSFGDRGDRAAALAAVRKHGGVLLTSYGMVQHNAGSVRASAQGVAFVAVS